MNQPFVWFMRLCLLPCSGGGVSLKDLDLICVDCDEMFRFSIAEQRFYAERGIKQPVRCETCRAERRAERNAALISNYESVRDATTWTEHQASSAGYGLSTGRSSKPARGPRQSYKAVCASCGKATEIPFQPRGGRPVYCRECFNARRGR